MCISSQTKAHLGASKLKAIRLSSNIYVYVLEISVGGSGYKPADKQAGQEACKEAYKEARKKACKEACKEAGMSSLVCRSEWLQAMWRIYSRGYHEQPNKMSIARTS